jgi:hypothetical protein
MTDTATANPLEVAISREPRLQAIGDKSLQMTIAGLMIGLGLDFSQAESQVLGIISNADAHKTAVAERLKTKRAETEKTFYDGFHDLLLDAVKATPKGDLPVGGFVINVDPDSEYKNADGSPMMDQANNPVRGPLVSFDFRWTPGKAKSASSGSSNQGRPEGDYLIEGDETVYKSMAGIAKAKYSEAEYEAYIKGSGATSRKFLTDKGYKVPESPVTDADGKKHWILTAPAAA